MDNQNSRDKLVGTATRALAIIGFIAVIIAGLWGSVTIARGVPSAFSALAAAIVSITSVFVPADEAITISVPSLTVGSGETFVLSWEHEQKSVEGTYTFRYLCTDGVSFTSPTQAGPNTEVFCNTPFNFLNANDSLVLTAFSETNRFADVTVFVDFTPNGAAAPTVSGSTLLTIENTDITSSPGTTTGGQAGGSGTTPRTAGPETTTIDVIPTGGPTASDPNGVVDLRVRFIELGLVDKATGEFTASSTPSDQVVGKRVAARFLVENIGSRTSDQWTFNAVLPTFPSHIYSSPTQPALGPGDRIEFTLGFDSFEADGEGELVVNVDPTRRINESNKENNILRQTIILAPNTTE